MWFLSFIAQTHYTENTIDSPFMIESLPSDIIWNKYPAVCPACFDFMITNIIQANNGDEAAKFLKEKEDEIEKYLIEFSNSLDQPKVCHCLSRINFAEERHNIYKKINYELDKLRIKYASLTRKTIKRKSIKELATMFESIFINSYHVFSVQTIAFHLLEEVGEVTQALKDRYTYDNKREPFTPELQIKRKLKLEEEIADVFSWIFALMLKLRYVYYQDAQEYFQTLLPKNQPVKIQFDFIEQINLAEIIWAKYGRNQDGTLNNTMVCTGCYKAPCECKRDLKIDWHKLSKNGDI